MLVSEALTQADEFRPNNVPTETKRAWLHAFEADIAEMMCVECPMWEDEPDPDCKLLIEHPKDYIYPLWIAPMIDLWNQDTQLYQIDYIVANNALKDIQGYYTRNKSNDSEDGDGDGSSSSNRMPKVIKGIFLK